MGWRAIRMALERPALLKLQVRALIRAATGRDLWIMFPMIAEVAEFLAAKRIVEEARVAIAERGYEPPTSIHLGTMIEIPSLFWQLDALLKAVDFVSIGSNDLIQFFFAADRSHPRLQGRYDPLSPAFLSLVRDMIRQARAHNVPINLCGEIAARPLEAMALLGVGLRSVSMAPAAIGPVKSMILSLDLSRLRAFLEPQLSRPDHSLRGVLRDYAGTNGIAI